MLRASSRFYEEPSLLQGFAVKVPQTQGSGPGCRAQVRGPRVPVLGIQPSQPSQRGHVLQGGHAAEGEGVGGAPGDSAPSAARIVICQS